MATGLITAAVALGVGQLVAGITGPQGSPVATVGGAAIDLTPPPVKNFAISAFGSHDKSALVAGILVLLAAFAAAAGVAAMRRLGYGLAALVIFAAAGLAAALTRPADSSAGVLPVLVGAAAGAVMMAVLVRTARGTPAPAAEAVQPGGQDPARLAADRSLPDGNDLAAPQHEPAGRAAEQPERSREPGASWVPAEPPPTGPGAPASGPASGSALRSAALRPAALSSAALGTASAGSGSGPGSELRPPPGRSQLGQPRPGRPSGQPPPTGQPAGPAGPPSGGRRQFLAAGFAGVAVAGASALGGRLLAERTSVSRARSALRFPAPAHAAPPLPPGTHFPIRGLSPFITPNSSFYRVDTALILPEVSPANWQLRVHGMVGREVVVSFRDLLEMPLTEDYVTLTCVSNPVGGPYIGNARWLGASLASLLRIARIRSGADQLICTSVDGFTSGTPVQTVMDGRDALLAVAMNGAPLPVAHGFPVRMVVPGLYGYVSACKWITDIKVTTFAAEHAYWAQRGWSQQAPIKTESRIDVPGAGTTVRAGRTPVAGVAWAQHKGIDAVEVRVDHGPWRTARLAAVPGIDTWRQWVFEWQATPGNHVIEARATDATGYTQTAAQAPPEPNGATGYPSVTVSVQ